MDRRSSNPLRVRKNGLKGLKREVNGCEYKDVHMLWEMLNKKDEECARRDVKAKKDEECARRDVKAKKERGRKVLRSLFGRKN